MQIEPRLARPFRIPSSALVAFFGITFFVIWGLIGVYILSPDLAVPASHTLTPKAVE
jgi:uncharacterized protein